MNFLEISERKMNAVGTLQERTIGRGVGMAKYEVVGVSESCVLKESFLQPFVQIDGESHNPTFTLSGRGHLILSLLALFFA